MEAQDPLSALRDIHLPAEPTSWPPAIGWWVLAALLVALAVVALRLLLHVYARRRRRAAALAALDQSLRRYRAATAQQGQDRAGLDFLNDINAVLKRVALAHYPADTVGGLHGADWLAFLDRCDGGDSFRAGPGAPLGDGPYRPRFEADPDAVYRAARRWIENRYRAAAPVPRRWRARPGGAGL